jgi:hypothetical protein
MQIQRRWRIFTAKRQLRLLKKIKAVKIKADIRLLREQKKLNEFRRTGAVLTLQRFWRRIQAGRRQKLLMKIIRARKAVIIQKYFRRHRARQLLRRLRREKIDRETRELNGAILVRVFWMLIFRHLPVA